MKRSLKKIAGFGGRAIVKSVGVRKISRGLHRGAEASLYVRSTCGSYFVSAKNYLDGPL